MKENFTVMLPVHRSNIPLANECLQNLLNVCDLNIILIDDNGNDDDYIKNERIRCIHNNFTERQPLVKIWNQCIKECPTEYVILAAWRQRPIPEHFRLIKEKLSEGYGMVAFDLLHFFALSKHLTTVIGWFDEGFLSGQYEDTDWSNRLRINNIGIYVGDIPEQRVVNSIYVPSMWQNGDINAQYYRAKWIETPSNGTLVQIKDEVNYTDRKIYDGVYPDRKYKTWEESVLPLNLIKYFNTFTNVVRNVI